MAIGGLTCSPASKRLSTAGSRIDRVASCSRASRVRFESRLESMSISIGTFSVLDPSLFQNPIPIVFNASGSIVVSIAAYSAGVPVLQG